MAKVRKARRALMRSTVVGPVVLALFLVLFVGSAPASPDHIWIVSTTADPGPAGCVPSPGGCSLRGAINAANAAGGTNAIDFTMFGASGVQTITLSSALPPIAVQTTIDGTTEPNHGSSPFGIAIDGGAVTDEVHNQITGGVQGMVLAPGSGGSTIRGLAFGNFNISQQADPALEIDSDGNTIAGDTFG
ncbi:MAG: hypothetical protein ACRDL7_08280, partial [Gaiellaceae bacterium]